MHPLSGIQRNKTTRKNMIPYLMSILLYNHYKWFKWFGFKNWDISTLCISVYTYFVLTEIWFMDNILVPTHSEYQSNFIIIPYHFKVGFIYRITIWKFNLTVYSKKNYFICISKRWIFIQYDFTMHVMQHLSNHLSYM